MTGKRGHPGYPYWTVAHRVFTSFKDALQYWTEYPATSLMEKLDVYTAAYVMRFPRKED